MSKTLGFSGKKLIDAGVEVELGMMPSSLPNEVSCIFDPVSYKKMPPIHVAAMKGHLSLVEEMLSCNPQLAEELDAHQSSPLHVASSNGHLEIVRELLRTAPEMCLSQDCHGRNPVHVAAVKGRVEVLKELVEKHPIAARERTREGLTLLHLCVKYQLHLDAFKEIVSKLRDLLDCKDNDGNNVLHMAARYNQVEIVVYLVKNTKIDCHATNLQGETARTIIKQATNLQKETARTIIKQTSTWYDGKILAMLKPKSSNGKWVTEQRDSIMVVAILIATMAFQAGVTPPGGVLQEEETRGENNVKYDVGVAVLAFTYPIAYKAFMYVNTLAFVLFLSAILLLISGLPFKRGHFMWILMVTMWLTITCTAATYAISILVVTPRSGEGRHGHRESLVRVIIFGLTAWPCLMAVLFGGNMVRLVNRWVQRKNGCNNIVEWVKHHAFGFGGAVADDQQRDTNTMHSLV